MNNPQQLMQTDLLKSGLLPEDMLTRILDNAERTACKISSNTEGYVIPYFDINGNMISFYRARLEKSDYRYKQVKGSPNHIYFPKNFMKVFKKIKYELLIITEGEKKAACCCKLGIPAIGLGGVDSWSNKVILVPKAAEAETYKHNDKFLSIRLPSNSLDDSITGVLAKGLEDIIDVVINKSTTVLICYDTDYELGVKPPVQRAAARLGYELRYKGCAMENVKQIVLPYDNTVKEKMSIDDFLMSKKYGKKAFIALMQETLDKPGAFPTHPNVREHISKKLQKPKLERKEMMNLSLGVITELDARGRRMYAVDEKQMYYFDGKTRKLMRVDINISQKSMIHESAFGKMLYKDFGVSAGADNRLMEWFGAQFAAEDPIVPVTPCKVIAKPFPNEDVIRYQINDGQYIRIRGNKNEPFQIVPNGTDNVLFQSDFVKDLNANELMTALELQRKEYDGKPIPFWWQDVMDSARLKEHAQSSILISLLYYASPWLYRWRGTQLPIELLIGESGSGKSSMAQLRLQILTGKAKLRNISKTVSDWHSSIANEGGLHMTDNVHAVDKQLKQIMSDEICRLITEPDPSIGMRKLYSNGEEIQLKINCIFGFTAIKQPFQNADFLQRAMLLEFSKNSNQETEFDPYWNETQLAKRGGRTGWLAHQIYVIHRFLQLVKEKWDDNYKAKHRLIHLEQIFMLLAELFDLENDWIPEHMVTLSDRSIGEADWVLEGLLDYAEYIRRKDPLKMFTAVDITSWMVTKPAYEKCYQLNNSRALGHYLTTYKNNVATVCGIIEGTLVNNKRGYRITSEAPRHVQLRNKLESEKMITHQEVSDGDVIDLTKN